jgi:cytoskeletal protein RodZ
VHAPVSSRLVADAFVRRFVLNTEANVALGGVMESIGSFLRAERLLKQLSLEELALTTRIPLKSLQLLEDDRLDLLPGDVFVRGFVKSYAKALGMAGDAVVKRFEETSRPSRTSLTALPAVAPADGGGRRFGLAMALVILLILFTLALSIVLRPRHRDAPVELSVRPVAALVVSA